MTRHIEPARALETRHRTCLSVSRESHRPNTRLVELLHYLSRGVGVEGGEVSEGRPTSSKPQPVSSIFGCDPPGAAFGGLSATSRRKRTKYEQDEEQYRRSSTQFKNATATGPRLPVARRLVPNEGR